MQTLTEKINQADLTQLTHLLDQAAQVLPGMGNAEADQLLKAIAKRVALYRVKLSLVNIKWKELELMQLAKLAAR